MHAHEIKCTGSISLTVDGYAGQQTLDHPLLAGHRRDLAQVRHGGHLPRAVLSDDVSVSSAANELARSSHFGTSQMTQAEQGKNNGNPADSMLRELHGSSSYAWNCVPRCIAGYCWMSVACLFLKGTVVPLL